MAERVTVNTRTVQEELAVHDRLKSIPVAEMTRAQINEYLGWDAPEVYTCKSCGQSFDGSRNEVAHGIQHMATWPSLFLHERWPVNLRSFCSIQCERDWFARAEREGWRVGE